MIFFRPLFLLLFFLFIPFSFFTQQSPLDSIEIRGAKTLLDTMIINSMPLFSNVNLFKNKANHTRDMGVRRVKWRARWIILKTFGIGPFFHQAPFSYIKMNGYLIAHGNLPKGWRGGVFTLVINRYNGALETVYHSR